MKEEDTDREDPYPTGYEDNDVYGIGAAITIIVILTVAFILL